MKQQIISLLERAKENGTTIGGVLAEVREISDGWQPIETAPKDGTAIIIACIEDGIVYDLCNGHIEVVPEDEEDGPWDIRNGEPWCSYEGRSAGTYFCCWLPGKEWETRWEIGKSPEYTHWMPLPAAPGAEDSASLPATPSASRSQQPIPNGWKLVPSEITLDMSIAFAEAWFSRIRPIDDPEIQDAYAAMLDAAPPAAAEHTPVADERAGFEAWASTQSDTWLIVGGLTWSPGTEDYASARTNAAFAAWQARAALASAPVAGEAQPVIHQHGFAADNQRLRAINESLDKQLEEVMTERDEYHDVADKLADAIADHLLVEIGEHSSSNCPWMRALEAIESAAPQASPDADGRDAKDAARWRLVRRKLCLTGNGDGTCAMQALNLPASIPGWPEPGDAVAEFCDAAIDAAIAAQQGEGGGV